MILYTPPKPPTHIPLVDFAGSFSKDPAEQRKVAWEIHKACRETGFFYVSNHRVPPSLIEAQFEWTHRFFDLPLEQKQLLHMKNSPSTAGYEPIGGQVLDSQDPNAEKAPPDLKESFYIGVELPEDHPISKKRWRSYGHNQWPANLPGFREQMLAYQSAMCEAGDRILAMMALSLDLPQDAFVPFYDMPTTTLRLLRYPPQPPNAGFNQIGAGAHTDWGGITLLAQDDLGGLEVQNVEGEWLQAKPIPGTFLINLGDLIARWTNGLYNSNMHRVRNNDGTGRNRHSIPFFYGPNHDAMIECLPTCTDAEHPPLHPPITAAEHLYEMFRRSYGFEPAA